MNPFNVNFQELYERHLCRHSQYGINVIHVAAVLGIYLAFAGIFSYFVEATWLLCLLIPHSAILALNVPGRVLLGYVFCMALLFAAILFLPRPTMWVAGVYALAIPLLYKVQAWSHKVYNVERDMTEFNKKYKKGYVLFVLLAIYELPLLLNYLVFDKNNRPAWLSRPRSETPPVQPGTTEG